MDLHERRQHERLIAWLPVVLSGGDAGSQPGTLVDLSGGGALVQTPRPVTVGAHVYVLADGGGATVAVGATVVGLKEGPGCLANLRFDEEQTAEAYPALAPLWHSLQS